MGDTDDSVGIEMERDVAEGSEGAEICTEVDSEKTGDIGVDSTVVGGEISGPNPLRAESDEVGLLVEVGRGTPSGPTSSEIVGSSEGGEMKPPTSVGSGSGSGSSLGVSTSASVMRRDE